MANPHTLTLTLGASTFSLSGSSTSSSQTLMRYVPKSPNLSTVDANSILRDGGRRVLSTRRNVTEEVSFRISASSADELRSTINDIERVFIRAENRQRIRSGSKIYVNWQPNGSASLYRSEINGGKIIPKDETLNWRWNRFDIEVDAVWNRSFYWEGPEMDIPLTNGAGTNTTSVLRIENHDDADSQDDNWVNISASDIEGVLSSPVKLLLENNDSDDTIKDVFIGHNVFAGGSSFNHVIEGEDATGGGSTVSATLNSGCAYRTRDWTSTTETELMQWSLDQDDLARAGGTWFHPIIRFSSTAGLSTTTFQLQIQDNTGVGTVWDGPEVKPPSARVLMSLGLIKLHPWGGDVTAPIDLVLALRGRSSTSANSTVNVDFIHLFATDSWRFIQVTVNNIDNTDRLVDDGIEGITYYDNTAGGDMISNISTSGDFIKVWPQLDQRVLFLAHSGTANSAPVDLVMGVQMKYRPRFLTV